MTKNVKANLIIFTFFLLNLLISKWQMLFYVSNYLYLLLLGISLFENREFLINNMRDKYIKFNSITLVKITMLVCVYFILIVLLQNIFRFRTNLLTAVFETPFNKITSINDYILKPTILFLYTYNVKQNLTFKMFLMWSFFLTTVINAKILLFFNIFNAINFLSWLIFLVVYLQINQLFYNKLLLWIIFWVCYMSLTYIF